MRPTGAHLELHLRDAEWGYESGSSVCRREGNPGFLVEELLILKGSLVSSGVSGVSKKTRRYFIIIFGQIRGKYVL